MPDTDPEKKRARARKWYEENRDRARAKQRIWYQNNREKALTYAKEWRENNPEKFKDYSLKFHYGLSLEEYNALWSAQGEACGGCGSTSPRHKKGWHLDHCHDTKKVRGILCHHCNISLGHMQDSAENLRRLADYIERHQ